MHMKVPIYIEGRKYIVKNSKNILETCLALGFNIPYFCWHPALGSVGSCRQCAVKCYDKDPNASSFDKIQGKLVMSCMTPVKQNIYVSLFEKSLIQFRKSILELLMIDHPHDCPVCEEGGNCHLQDMTIMTGHTYRRYRFTKRTHRNQYLGPLISHEMNRCITCYRCVRYYKDYAGGQDLGVFGVHNNIYFGRVCDGMLQSEFSGNLVEICPTGVFTDKTRSENYARKWDTMFIPSICQQCSVGCNIILGERYGKLCRVENRYNGSINGYFLCDRGRFGCDYIDLDNRLKKPIKKQENNYVNLSQNDAVQEAVRALNLSHKIIGIGSSRASMESNFALRNLVGKDNFFTGIHRSEQERLLLILEILSTKNFYTPSVREIENYDAILILGEDLTQTSARIALAIRQAIKGKSYEKEAYSQGVFDWQFEAVANIAQNRKNPLFITSLDKTKLDDLAMLTYYDSVKNQARFGFAIAHALDSTAPAVEGIDQESYEKINIVVKALMKSDKPLIVSGTNSGSKELIESASNIAQALKNLGKNVGITFVANDVNSMGISMIENKSLDDAITLLNNNNNNKLFTTLIILENDLYCYANSVQIQNVLKNVNYLIVLDHQKNKTQEQANLILPSSSFAESNGTVINYEGRAQRFFKLYDSRKYYDNNIVFLESWKWIYLIFDLYSNQIRKKKLNIDYITDSIISCFPNLVKIRDAAPNTSFRVHGQKIAQAPHRYSGRTAMNVNVNIHESSVAPNDDTFFIDSMEGSHSNKSSHKQISFAWFPGWNSPQAWNKFQNFSNRSLYPEDPGVRLLDTVHQKNFLNNNKNQKIWFSNIPDDIPVKNRKLKNWTIAPYWHLFGSEYTSQRSRYIQKCMSQSYVMLNVLDVTRLNIKDGMFLKFCCADQFFCLPIRVSNHLPIFHIGLPIGFPDIPIFFSDMSAKNVEGVVLHCDN